MIILILLSAATVYPASRVVDAAALESQAEYVGTPYDKTKGRVVFFRRARHTDGYFSGPCRVNEQTPGALIPVTQIKGNRYTSVLVDPGVHRYVVKSERTDNITLEVESGEEYFVECAMESGWASSNPDLRPSTKEIFQGYLPNLKPR